MEKILLYIYKYTKGAQSTETDEKDSDSDTERQHGQNNMFFLLYFSFYLTGVTCVGVKTTKT